MRFGLDPSLAKLSNKHCFIDKLSIPAKTAACDVGNTADGKP
jgi:hypothetical protein